MTNNKFIYDEDRIITGVKNEELISICSFNLPTGFNEEIKVLVTKEKEYYNIYVIDSRFIKEPINCLKLQEPIEEINNPIEYFNEMRLEIYAIEHYLWAKYSKNDKVLGFNIEVIKE